MISTWSKFVYGTTIAGTNYLGDFKEGSTAYVATLLPGPRTLGELLVDVQTALNLVGGQVYTVAINRTTGIVTVSAPGTFILPLATGVNIGNMFWPLLGFTQGTDLTGANTYSGKIQAASTYYPQFLLQSYIGPDDYKTAIDPTVNRTASGRTELVSFGIDQLIEFELKFLTDLKMDGLIIRNDPSGLEKVRAFLQEITTKSRFEFMPDFATPSTFYKCVLESIDQNKTGSGYKLKELYTQGLPGIFETGILQLRVVP